MTEKNKYQRAIDEFKEHCPDEFGGGSGESVDISNKQDKGKLTISGVEYSIRVSTEDSGAEGYITFVAED